MKGIWQVVRWELIRHLRNKQFWFTLLLTPIIFGLFAGVPTLLERVERQKEIVYAVVDEIGAFDTLQRTVPADGELRFVQSADEETARHMVLDGEAEGYFTLHDEFVVTGQTVVYMDEVKPRPNALIGAVTGILRGLRMEEQQLDQSVLDYVSAQASLPAQDLVTEEAEEAEEFFRGLPVAIVFAILLFYLIMSSCSMLLQSALQEKRDRMSEVILSSIEPNVLMGGKIIGHFTLGILQLSFWLAIGLPIIFFVIKMPLSEFIDFATLPFYIVFMLLGYLLFAAIFVGVGSTMEDMQSASNSQGFVYLLPALSFFVMGPVIANPSGGIARVATFFPLTSPIVSMIRIGLNALTMWETALAVLILLVSTYVVTIAAAKIFRTGMLMYGKTASFKEIWKWIRHA